MNNTTPRELESTLLGKVVKIGSTDHSSTARSVYRIHERGVSWTALCKGPPPSRWATRKHTEAPLPEGVMSLILGKT